jgi:hypothetical protein
MRAFRGSRAWRRRAHQALAAPRTSRVRRAGRAGRASRCSVPRGTHPSRRRSPVRPGCARTAGQDLRPRAASPSTAPPPRRARRPEQQVRDVRSAPRTRRRRAARLASLRRLRHGGPVNRGLRLECPPPRRRGRARGRRERSHAAVVAGPPVPGETARASRVRAAPPCPRHLRPARPVSRGTKRPTPPRTASPSRGRCLNRAEVHVRTPKPPSRGGSPLSPVRPRRPGPRPPPTSPLAAARRARTLRRHLTTAPTSPTPQPDGRRHHAPRDPGSDPRSDRRARSRPGTGPVPLVPPLALPRRGMAARPASRTTMTLADQRVRQLRRRHWATPP